MNKYCAIIIFCIGIILTSCAQTGLSKTHVGNLSIASTHGIPAKEMGNLSKTLVAKGIEGKHMAEKGSLEGTLEKAIENALNNVRGNVMMNCKLYLIQEGDKRGFLVVGDVYTTSGDE